MQEGEGDTETDGDAVTLGVTERVAVHVVDADVEGLEEDVGVGEGEGGGLPTKISNLKLVTRPALPAQDQSGLSAYPQ